MKKQPKMTRWFGMSLTPSREGVYQERDGEFSRWANGQWHLLAKTVDEAAREKTRSSSMYNGDCSYWRGLASDPKAKP